MMKSVRAVNIRRAGGREFQILGAATLKLRAPNEVRTNGRDSYGSPEVPWGKKNLTSAH